MMTYKDFLDYVKENILSCMPPEYSHAEVDIFKVTKDNNLVLDGMTIRKDANGPSPIIYLEQYYGRITDKKDAKTVIEEIASDYFSAFKYYKGLGSGKGQGGLLYSKRRVKQGAAEGQGFQI